MEITKTKTTKNTVELRSELNSQGVTIENVYVNGKKFTTIGYCSERDKLACLRAIQTAVDGSETLYEAMHKLMTNANLTDNDIEPDEEVKVGGVSYYVSYKDKTLYDSNGKEVVNCKELTCKLPDEACKTILLQKLELAMHEYCECVDEDDDELDIDWDALEDEE